MPCSDKCSDSLFVFFGLVFFGGFFFVAWIEILKETSFSPGIVCFFDVQNKKNDSFARVLDTKEVPLTRVNQIEKRCESCINNKWSFRDNEKTRRIEVNW